jgi:hypothetical protein
LERKRKSRNERRRKKETNKETSVRCNYNSYRWWICTVKSLQWKWVPALNRPVSQKSLKGAMFRTFEIALCHTSTVSVNGVIMWQRRCYDHCVNTNEIGGIYRVFQKELYNFESL